MITFGRVSAAAQVPADAWIRHLGSSEGTLGNRLSFFRSSVRFGPLPATPLAQMASDTPPSLSIGDHAVGPHHPCFVIAEVAQAHDGSLGTAHAYIDAVAETGAHALKFQTHFADAESSSEEPFRVRFSPQDETRYDYWRRMEFTEQQWRGLAAHARERDLVFLSSPFSIRAVELLDRLDVAAWKVASGEITNTQLLSRMAATRRPLLLSTGLAVWEDIDEATRIAQNAGAAVALLQSTTSYPCPPEKTGLNLLAEMRRRYACPVGLSDHSGGIFAGLAAATLGANLVEVHVVLSRRSFGPDVPASVTIEELRTLVQGIRFVHRALEHPLDMTVLDEDRLGLRKMFGRSLFAARDVVAGAALSAADVVLKKPGTGIAASRLAEFVGRRLGRDLAAGQRLTESDFE